MRILRLIVVGGVFGLSVLAIGFVSVDRLAHLPTPAAPQRVQAPVLTEPQGTGSILPLGLPEEASAGAAAALRPTGARPSAAKASAGSTSTSAGKAPVTKTASAKTAPAKPKSMEGFDTERLNALLRGDPITPPRR